MMKRRDFMKKTALGTGGLLGGSPFLGAAEKKEPFVLAVMDPLALDLACSCVAGFAQRKYRVLAEHLKTVLDRPVDCVLSNALKPILAKSSTGKIDLVIGKDADTRYLAKQTGMTLHPLARLTNKNGDTTFHGLFVVKTDDPVQTLGEVKNHKIVFGPEYTTEKRIEPVRMLKKTGIIVPENPLFKNTCKDAALEILENESGQPMCAVISDYAIVLLEGCDTIERGSLRILARTPEVPFITAFASNKSDEQATKSLFNALVSFGKNEQNLDALESKSGFVKIENNENENS